MQVEQMSIPGAWVFTPQIHWDRRGAFLEWFRGSDFEEATGQRFELAQANCSISARGVVRGVHLTRVPPGQGKFVTCVAGAVNDVVVDLRIGSPTYGSWDSVRLDQTSRRAVYIAPGLGHGFCALEDHSIVVYMCDTAYDAAQEVCVQPLDPGLAIDWGLSDVPAVLSVKDQEAPSLEEAEGLGLLPSRLELGQMQSHNSYQRGSPMVTHSEPDPGDADGHARN